MHPLLRKLHSTYVRTYVCMYACMKVHPPLRRLHIDAGICIKPAISNSTDERSNAAGTPREQSILAVTGDAEASSCRAFRSPLLARSRLMPSMSR